VGLTHPVELVLVYSSGVGGALVQDNARVARKVLGAQALDESHEMAVGCSACQVRNKHDKVDARPLRPVLGPWQR
jgi:hypothetical protein